MLQLLNLAIFTTLSLFNLLAVPAPHLLSLFLAPQAPTISSLKITDRSFSYASPRLWNQISDSFRHHHSRLDSPPHPLVNSSLTSSTLSSSITPSLFHSRLKSYLFNKSFPPYFFYLRNCLTITGLDRTYHAHHFIFSFDLIFLFVPCGRLSWLPVSFLLHVKYTLSYRIVSYSCYKLQ